MNMMGEPNQLNRATVFGYDGTYPSGVDWNEFSQGGGFTQEPSFSSFATAQQVPTVTNFSFYSNFGPVPSPISFPLAQVHHYENQLQNRVPQATFRCKRKTDSPPRMNVKQHITEERMAEHLSKLHISSERPAPSTHPETSESQEKRLYMCDEMRKLQTESIIPASLLERIQRPCTALVLWTPPRRAVPHEGSSNHNNNSNNNNEEEVPDNNLMELDR